MQPTLLSAQAILGSSGVGVTLKWMGTDTQTFCVKVTVLLVPFSSVTQVTVGAPWQVTVMVPTTATGVRRTGADTFTHWFPTLSQPFTGQDFSTW